MSNPRWLLAPILAVYALLARTLWFVCDDAYISFRYARNLLRGDGLVYNVGEPVEGYSNLLWVLIEAPLLGAGLDLVWVMPTLSAACGAVLIWRVFEVLLGPLDAGLPGAAGGAGIVALAAPVACWASSGLETMAFALALFLCIEGLVIRSRTPWFTVFPLVAVALLRAEGPLWVLGLGGLGVLGGRKPWMPLGVALGVVAATFGWRWTTYGSWAPNTAVAKVGLSGALLARGARYVGTALVDQPALALSLGGLGLLGRSRWQLGVVVAAGLLFPIAVGGDFMPFFRMVVPVVAPLGLLGGLLIARWSWAGPALGLAALLGTVSVFDIHPAPQALRDALHFRIPDTPYLSERGHWENEVAHVGVLTRLGTELCAVTQPDDAVVGGAIGALGWACDRPILDRYGLVTPAVAAREVDTLIMPGHDKRVSPFFFVDQAPTVLFAQLLSQDALNDTVSGMIQDLVRRDLTQSYAPQALLLDDGRVLLLIRHTRGQVDAAWAPWGGVPR